METIDRNTSIIIGVACGVGIIFAAVQFLTISLTKISALGDAGETKESVPLVGKGLRIPSTTETTEKLREIHAAISIGAEAFLKAEYSICLMFMLLFAIVIFALISWGQNSVILGALTVCSFLLGAFTSILCGYIGMRVAVFSNVRTTINAQKEGYRHCFNTAFRAGSVMGFALTGLAIIMLYILLILYRLYFVGEDQWGIMMDCIAGYGLGGSSIAMFGRVGGGIFTKAADVGADLVGKVIHGIPEDDPRNPATIADNVGDNVGDVAGMGADLFGSFAESTCAALVIAAHTADLRDAGWGCICFPLLIASSGLLVCFVISFLATHLFPVRYEKDIEIALRLQIVITTLVMIPISIWIASVFLPSTFVIYGLSRHREASNMEAFLCVIVGTIGGMIIGLSTEYFTSHSYAPVRELAHSCRTGASTNIIYGLALGYKSVIIPIFILAIIIYISFYFCDLYGVALSAVGMLSTLATGLTIDAYGPVCDNAGGIAEMAHMPASVREKTDALDAAGNTTAAIGKGFAIGSASLVSLALYGAFVTRVHAAQRSLNPSSAIMHVDILEPKTFAFLLIGAMLPYWFSSMTMKSVGKAAIEMMREVERQFADTPDLLNEHTKLRPDYARCVTMSTQASLREMVAPACLVILSPLIVGTFFGVHGVYGLLTGAMLSGVQMAISMSNTGGAWDNAKKYIAAMPVGSELGGKGSDCYRAAVIADTVGDPMKDTSGPSLNILMKLMAIISLVFANYFLAINDGKGIFYLPLN
eukprot:gene7651-15661_t